MVWLLSPGLFLQKHIFNLATVEGSVVPQKGEGGLSCTGFQLSKICLDGPKSQTVRHNCNRYLLLDLTSFIELTLFQNYIKRRNKIYPQHSTLPLLTAKIVSCRGQIKTIYSAVYKRSRQKQYSLRIREDSRRLKR